MNRRNIIMILLGIVIILLIHNHITNSLVEGYDISTEAGETIGSLFQAGAGTLNNLNLTGDLGVAGDLDVAGNFVRGNKLISIDSLDAEGVSNLKGEIKLGTDPNNLFISDQYKGGRTSVPLT
jgi:hypothetical protein